jgi:hypothetical protein
MTGGLALTTAAQAEDPSFNRCWGEIASGTAQYDSDTLDEGDHGGTMGMHARSTEAANINGGFAASDNGGIPVEFNVKEDGGNAGRKGVANVSKEDHDLPKNGGNGVHAVANGGFAAALDPATGEFIPDGGDPIECSLAQ